MGHINSEYESHPKRKLTIKTNIGLNMAIHVHRLQIMSSGGDVLSIYDPFSNGNIANNRKSFVKSQQMDSNHGHIFSNSK